VHGSALDGLSCCSRYPRHGNLHRDGRDRPEVKPISFFAARRRGNLDQTLSRLECRTVCSRGLVSTDTVRAFSNDLRKDE
jgi:hypothetical protein